MFLSVKFVLPTSHSSELGGHPGWWGWDWQICLISMVGAFGGGRGADGSRGWIFLINRGYEIASGGVIRESLRNLRACVLTNRRTDLGIKFPPCIRPRGPRATIGHKSGVTRIRLQRKQTSISVSLLRTSRISVESH
jgi:hypothetical protein